MLPNQLVATIQVVVESRTYLVVCCCLNFTNDWCLLFHDAKIQSLIIRTLLHWIPLALKLELFLKYIVNFRSKYRECQFLRYYPFSLYQYKGWHLMLQYRTTNTERKIQLWNENSVKARPLLIDWCFRSNCILRTYYVITNVDMWQTKNYDNIWMLNIIKSMFYLVIYLIRSICQLYSTKKRQRYVMTGMRLNYNLHYSLVRNQLLLYMNSNFCLSKVRALFLWMCVLE